MSSWSSSSASSSASVDATPSSSCTWTQRDVDGKCVLAPRSCYDCLNTPPATGERCTLAPDGVCKGASAYDPTRDYTRDGWASAFPPRLNFFRAGDARYCERNDKLCTYCREKSFQSWKTYQSQYCTGLNGCVCVAICEADQWETAIQPTLQETLQQQQTNGSNLNCTVQPVGGDVAASTETAVDFVGLTPSKKDVLASEDECMWYQTQQYCGSPRSCFDCLNTPLYNGNKCMLHSSGYCTSIAAFNYTKYYLRSNNSYTALFPSTNTTYCSSTDSKCQSCRTSAAFAQWTNVSSRAEFCTGDNGCVCVASCESPQWKSSVVNLTCNTSAIDQAVAFTMSPVYRLSDKEIIMYTVLSCFVSMLCAFGLLWLYRRHVQRQNRRQPQRTRSPKGPVLELSGWKAMREKLIEHEREFVGDAEDEPGSHQLVHLTGVDAPIAAEPNGEPPMVVVEGDAYRPVSPSRMHQ